MAETMRAMVLERAGGSLKLRAIPVPQPEPGQLLLSVSACGVCRTDLHILDGELAQPKLPLVMGHQVVGKVVKIGGAGGPPATNQAGQQPAPPFTIGDRVGVPWLGGSCGRCEYCIHSAENLCAEARYTGYQLDGGFAEYCVADARFCFPLPTGYPDLQAAPLLCAGLIGYRAWCMAIHTSGADGSVRDWPMTGTAARQTAEGLPSRRVGFYGFGAAAHILCQLAVHQGREVYAFTTPGDTAAQDFARSMGAVWAGGSDEAAPAELDSAIIFAPVGELVPVALRAVRRGGTVVCAGIHMSDIPQFPYSLLWGERVLRSVANLTRHDGAEFLALAPQIPIRTEVHAYPLEHANEALADLRAGRFTGVAVITLQ
jgi:alcohol dehydrogenase, propanol-preferring